MMTIPNSGIAQAAKTIAGNFHIIKIIPARNYRRQQNCPGIVAKSNGVRNGEKLAENGLRGHEGGSRHFFRI
jgi:hypothetical protein